MQIAWQDVWIALSTWGYSIAVVYQIVDNYRNKKGAIIYATAIQSAVLAAYRIPAFLSIGYWTNVYAGIVSASLWSITAYQRYQYRDRTRPFRWGWKLNFRRLVTES